MRVSLAICLVLSVFSCAEVEATTSSQLRCQLKKSYLLDRYEHRTEINALLSDVAAGPAKIVIFGESHFENADPYFDAATALKAKDSGFDCLFLERDRATFEQALDLFNANKSVEESVSGSTIDKYDFLNLTSRQSEPAHNAADWRAAGFKIFAIDEQAGIGLFGTAPILTVEKRNVAMAKKMTSLFASGQCKRGILATGHAHLAKIPGVLPIDRHLDPSKLPVYKIALTEPGYNSMKIADGEWTWQTAQGSPICRENPGVLAETFAFRNTEEIQQVGSLRGDGVPGSWADFNAVLVLGCSSKSKCQPYLGTGLEADGYLNRAAHAAGRLSDVPAALPQPSYK